MENQSANAKYYPQLDAIRGIAVLAVFFYHTLKSFSGNNFISKAISFFCGNLFFGIDMFFVLSSFLLTYLGLQEYRNKGFFSFKKYMVRRILRIWPLYFLIMFFSFVVLKQIKVYYNLQITLPPASWYLFFVSNYYTAGHQFFLQILWTISVEEQFYLLWGFCLTFFQKKMLFVIILIASVSFIFNIWGAVYEKKIYLNTLSYLLDMMIGAYTAYALITKNFIVTFISRTKKQYDIFYYSFFPLLFILYFLVNQYLLGGGPHRILEEVVREFMLIFFGFLILHQMLKTESNFFLGNIKYLVFIGKISFGIYCFHGIVITFCALLFNKFNLHFSILFNSIVMLIITILVASISYKYLEKPFLNLKSKFGY